MSGNPTGSNVVPMPHAPAPAPAPQMPVPMPGMWGGGSLPWGPGCCPPGGMDALMKCWCDVQAATAFICSVMVQCVQTNPAVVQAIITAIENSGSSLPLLGVTNGSNAQPGQVGEWVRASGTLPYTTAATTGTLSIAVLSPGDWDVWLFGYTDQAVHDIQFITSPVPTGFSDALTAVLWAQQDELVSLSSTTVRASLTVPTLVPVVVNINVAAAGPGAGTATVIFAARRVR